MGLFENLPFTNFDNLNLDMIVKDISTMKGNEEYLKDKVDEMEECCEQVQDNITNIQEDITNIYQQIGDIDIESLEGRVDVLEASDTAQNNEINSIKSRLTAAEEKIATNEEDIADNDEASRGRDDALSARIRNLEQATIHDIYNYYGSKNLILFGSDLRGLPAACRDSDGYPFEWGNKFNQRFYVGTETARSFIYSFANSNGGALIPNPDSTSYDYYQLGKLPEGLSTYLSPSTPMTLTLVVGSEGVSFGKYQHTFTSYNDIWTIAPNCQIKFGKFNTQETPLYESIWLMGTPANWRTFFEYDDVGIIFAFLEYGEGSIDITGNIPYDVKDREFFGHDATPSIDITTIEGNASATATVTYYDQVGEPQTLEAGVNLVLSASKYGKVVDGYLQMTINLQNNLGDKLASGANFTLANVAMSYLSADALPMPRGSSTLLGVASDSRSVEWDYVNTQNAYIWFNIDSGAGAIGNRGTFNVKLISSGLRNYTSGSATGNTMLKIPFHYIAS